MSLAPSKTPPSAKAAFDLDYSIHDFEVDPHPDSQFLYRRIEEAMLGEAVRAGDRVLDVACGAGKLVAQARQRGAQGWGLEPSQEMIGISRWLYPAEDVILVRGVAERLPFADGSFDAVACQGSLDHFVDPRAFMGEAARVVRPRGRVVIALANYESLSCRLGRLVTRLEQAGGRSAQAGRRHYWEIPLDHYHKGDYRFVRRLGGDALRLERCYGLSLLWLLRGEQWTWGEWLERRPRRVREALLDALDRIAYRLPALADMIVSVWRPARGADG